VAVDKLFDYHAKLILIAARIDQMKQRWPLPPPSIDHSHSFTINNNADLNSNTFPSPALSAMTNQSFDYKSKLVRCLLT